jgi:hypothetical protein
MEKEFQEFLDELTQVCVKHNKYLVGTCEQEGIYGEISIGGLGKDEGIGWLNLSNTSTQLSSDSSPFYVGRIGNFQV